MNRTNQIPSYHRRLERASKDNLFRLFSLSVDERLRESRHNTPNSVGRIEWRTGCIYRTAAGYSRGNELAGGREQDRKINKTEPVLSVSVRRCDRTGERDR